MPIKRSDIRIHANSKKVILLYLNLGVQEIAARPGKLVRRILTLEEDEVKQLHHHVMTDFKHRHRHFDQFLESHYHHIQSLIPQHAELSAERKQLIGAFFTKEYSIRTAALFNPSMVAHPDQSGMAIGDKRFIISLRAVGEGHISSIEFQSGVVSADGTIKLDKDSAYATRVTMVENSFDTQKFKKRTAVLEDFDHTILDELGATFTKSEYTDKAASLLLNYDEKAQNILADLVDTNYDVTADPDSPLSERVIFPIAKQECNGMEDVRFVEFKENGKSTYIGTYTAYDGHRITPQLIITEDFLRFNIRTMYGEGVNGKGFALFPEKLNGQFVMLGRQGGEDLTIMFSDDLFIWKKFKTIYSPTLPWELTQVGNCGSPIKTDQGWLVITHGVGPLRKYAIGAILLDLENPMRVTKVLEQPFLSPNEEEREGYVPNVVYSCGSMVHNDLLVIPYAMSDSASTFATIGLAELLNNMVSCEA
jgi:predicted GH43/DUF377 family glycosyl hydrolase